MMIKKIFFYLITALMLTNLCKCQRNKKTADTFETLVNSKIETIRIGKYRDLYVFPAKESTSSTSLDNYVFKSIECSIDSSQYYSINGSKPIFKDAPIPIKNSNGKQKEDIYKVKDLANKKVEGVFITKKDTMYYLRSFFVHQDKDYVRTNKIRLSQPIAIYKSEDSLYRYFIPLNNSRLQIRKSTEISKKTSTTFNSGSVTSSWAMSNIHLKLGTINFYGINRFGSSENRTQQENIAESLEAFSIEYIQVDGLEPSPFTYFKTRTRATSFGLADFFNEDTVLSN